MKVLVTGREGQLARSLVEGAPQDIEIVTIGRPELDLELPESIERAILDAAPDVVVNAAAYTGVDKAEDEPERAFRINAEGAGEVAAAARRVGAPVIQISTDYVFDGRSSGPYAEESPTGPLNVYGRSKLAGEEAVRAANPDHVILRTAWVYSPFGRNFVKIIMAAAQNNDALTVVDDQFGSPTSALNLADGILSILDRWRGGVRAGLGETFHLAGSGTASWYGFAEAIMAECKRLGLPGAEVRAIRTADWPTKALRPANSALDSSKFGRTYGYRAPDWRVSLRPVVERLARSR